MRIVALCSVLILAVRVEAAELTRDKGLAAVVDYALAEQRAYSWDTSDEHHTRLIVDISGHVYEVRDGNPPTSLPLPNVTKACFGSSINVAKDMYKLSDPKDSPWNKADRVAEVGHLSDFLATLVKEPGKIGGVEVGGALLTSLTFFLEYQVGQIRLEAEHMQAYLDTPDAQSKIKTYAATIEHNLRPLQILIVDRKYFPSEKIEKPKTPIDFAVNGRPECFPPR